MEEYIYEGIVLTSIDVVDSPTSTAPSRVTFSTATRGTRNDTTATFIHKVRDVKDPSGEEAELLEAEKLSVEQVRSLINGESEDNVQIGRCYSPSMELKGTPAGIFCKSNKWKNDSRNSSSCPSYGHLLDRSSLHTLLIGVGPKQRGRRSKA